MKYGIFALVLGTAFLVSAILGTRFSRDPGEPVLPLLLAVLFLSGGGWHLYRHFADKPKTAPTRKDKDDDTHCSNGLRVGDKDER